MTDVADPFVISHCPHVCDRCGGCPDCCDCTTRDLLEHALGIRIRTGEPVDDR